MTITNQAIQDSKGIFWKFGQFSDLEIELIEE